MSIAGWSLDLQPSKEKRMGANKVQPRRHSVGLFLGPLRMTSLPFKSNHFAPPALLLLPLSSILWQEIASVDESMVNMWLGSKGPWISSQVHQLERSATCALRWIRNHLKSNAFSLGVLSDNTNFRSPHVHASSKLCKIVRNCRIGVECEEHTEAGSGSPE